ncbi:MAG TPA: ribosome-associated translation inhibitor RaiA [Acidimicrobiia bacterium]|nr:ribosome-associated translation inhibitor RaiA [Acidimicrobiia bacterium]
MDVVVFGKHVEVDPALRAMTLEKLDRIGKFAHDVRRVDVDYGVHQTRRAGDSCTCEILVHLPHHLVKGTAAAVEHVMALDLALEKVEHQMRRLHERRVRRGNRARSRNGTVDSSTNGRPTTDVDDIDDFAGADALDGFDDHDDTGPTIVKSKQFTVKPMNPEEAALQMELLGHDFFLFRNSESESAAVLYRRRDGALGLIEVTG